MTLDMDEIVGESQFHKSVMYSYNERTHSFMFYTPSGDGKQIVPIGMFSPIIQEEIPYDPAALVELIADFMSREKYTFDSCNIYQRIGIHTLVIVVSEVCSDIYFSLEGYTFEISKVGGT